MSYRRTSCKIYRKNDILNVDFFFQAEDGIRDRTVTGVQTCALPISHRRAAVDGAEVPRQTVRAPQDDQQEGGGDPVLPRERRAGVRAPRRAARGARAAERPTHRARPRGRGVPPRLVRLWTRPARVARRLL